MTTESIYNGKTEIIPFADVQNLEKVFWAQDSGNNKKGDLKGYYVITKHTNWDMQADTWGNAVFLPKDEGIIFIKEWSNYRKLFEESIEPMVNKIDEFINSIKKFIAENNNVK